MSAHPQLDSAAAYRAYYDEMGHHPSLQVIGYRPDYMRWLLPCLARNRVLELGAGTGGSMVVMALLGNRVTVVEISAPLCARFESARNTLPCPIADRLRMIHGAIEDLGLPERFDWVVLTEVLEHVIDPVRVLQVARAHAEPHGQLYVTAPAVRVGGASHVRGVPREALELWLGQSRWRAAQWRCNDAGQGLPEPYRQTVCFAEAA